MIDCLIFFLVLWKKIIKGRAGVIYTRVSFIHAELAIIILGAHHYNHECVCVGVIRIYQWASGGSNSAGLAGVGLKAIFFFCTCILIFFHPSIYSAFILHICFLYSGWKKIRKTAFPRISSLKEEKTHFPSNRCNAELNLIIQSLCYLLRM